MARFRGKSSRQMRRSITERISIDASRDRAKTDLATEIAKAYLEKTAEKGLKASFQEEVELYVGVANPLSKEGMYTKREYVTLQTRAGKDNVTVLFISKNPRRSAKVSVKLERRESAYRALGESIKRILQEKKPFLEIDPNNPWPRPKGVKA